MGLMFFGLGYMTKEPDLRGPASSQISSVASSGPTKSASSSQAPQLRIPSIVRSEAAPHATSQMSSHVAAKVNSAPTTGSGDKHGWNSEKAQRLTEQLELKLGNDQRYTKYFSRDEVSSVAKCTIERARLQLPSSELTTEIGNQGTLANRIFNFCVITVRATQVANQRAS